MDTVLIPICYHDVAVADYTTKWKEALGNFMGTLIDGFYEGIRKVTNDVSSDLKKKDDQAFS